MTIKEILNLARKALCIEKKELYSMLNIARKYNYHESAKYYRERIMEINIKIDQINTLDKKYHKENKQ